MKSLIHRTFPMTMRYLIGIILVVALVQPAFALTPLPDNSPEFFAGEWAGIGEHGTYCYLNLSADGRGLALIDRGGVGNWFGARIHWRNRQQTLEVERVVPLPAAPQLRILPLNKLSLQTGFNQSLQLIWGKPSDSCHVQKIETTADRLTQARRTVERLPPSDERR
ncbi:MAG: hypothetical protein IT389_02140 [Nitrospira sp.]|nr:hypothetical protein [Nitrospira sp.]